MSDMNTIEALLSQMRSAFLNEIAERCDRLENLVIDLERAPRSREIFDDLYRNVHSLKGSGGTHGLHFLSTVCHQLENHLTEASTEGDFSSAFFSKALAYIDLLRKVSLEARADGDYASLEAELEGLRARDQQRMYQVLLAEPSNIMQHLFRKSLTDHPVRITVVEDGILAIDLLMRQHFDAAVVARELIRLNGIAVVAAIRASAGKNARTPFVLITSNPETVPPDTGIDKVIPRNKRLMDDVVHTLIKLVTT
jgi:chemotaxis protein histidine kinase CheA